MNRFQKLLAATKTGLGGIMAKVSPAGSPLALPGAELQGREVGRRSSEQNAVKAMYQGMWVDPETRQAIMDLRLMDRIDPRVKRIHNRVAADTVRGGLVLVNSNGSEVIRRRWNDYCARLQLNRPAKLRSDARALVMTGNLPMQWVLDDQYKLVLGGIAMPAETIKPNVNDLGRFKDVTKAYSQVDYLQGRELASFALWQLSMARLDPDSYDDCGSLGRPMLDAARTTWKKLIMSEEDLVIRRRTRAPQKLVHVLEGATDAELDAYRARVEANQADIRTDYYTNKKGAVTAIQGDAQMGEVNDVVHLLDTFFAASPFTKHLLGYMEGLSRDVLEDLKRAYYDDLDFLQDELAFVYNLGFQLELLLNGINPMDAGYKLKYAERRTETDTQLTDRMLKWMALGIPEDMRLEEMGMDPAEVRRRRDKQKEEDDPYPGGPGDDAPEDVGKPPAVKVTPGNGRKGESATDISVRS